MLDAGQIMGITGLSILSVVYLIQAIQMMRRKKSPTKSFVAAGLESMSKLAYGPVKGLKSASADF